MYICNCNGLTERQVKAAVDAGARKWSDVHAHYGCEPQCGCCGAGISARIHGTEADDAPSPMAGALAKA